MALSVFGLFLFYFCLARGEQVTETLDFGWQSKGEDHFRSWFPFFFSLVTILYCSDIVWSKDLFACFFCFLPIFDRQFSFFSRFLPLFDWEFPLFVFSHSFYFLSFFCFLLRARIDILTLGQG